MIEKAATFGYNQVKMRTALKSHSFTIPFRGLAPQIEI